MILKLNPYQKRQPIGGHHIIEHGVTFRGETAKEVAEKLRAFRISNAIPVGDPEQDVFTFYLMHWPFMVQEDETATAPKTSKDYENWRDWVTRTWAYPPRKMLTQKEAKDRWAICQKCPCNFAKKWEETPESAETTRRAYILRRGVDVPKDLGFCVLHKADLSVFTFIDNPKDFSTAKDTIALAKDCWV